MSDVPSSKSVITETSNKIIESSSKLTTASEKVGASIGPLATILEILEEFTGLTRGLQADLLNVVYAAESAREHLDNAANRQRDIGVADVNSAQHPLYKRTMEAHDQALAIETSVKDIHATVDTRGESYLSLRLNTLKPVESQLQGASSELEKAQQNHVSSAEAATRYIEKL